MNFLEFLCQISVGRRFRKGRGFTLLELLVSVVVIGILASLALIKFGSAQEKAYVATMQSDLRNFATARAIYMSESDQLPGSAAGVSGYHFSELVFQAGYQEDSATEWALLVGHNKTETRCVLSTYQAEGGSHRISCARELALDFEATSSGSTVTVDAGPAINALAFAPDEVTGAAWAARPEDIAVVSWEYGDGVREGGSPEAYTVRTHTYAEPGEYTVKLTLVKKTGEVKSGTKVAEVTGIVHHAPVASFTYTPTSPETGSPVTFTSTSTDANGDALTLTWDIAGTAASGTSVQATFSAAGTYTVKLTANDGNGGTHTTSEDVVVAQAIRGVATDFSEYAVGSAPSGWTPRGYASGTYAIRQKWSLEGSKSLEFTDGNSGSGLRVLSWDAVGIPTDVEVFSRMRLNGGSSTDIMGLVVRGSGGSGMTGYTLGFSSFNNQIELRRWLDGTALNLAAANSGWAPGVMVNVRFRVVGSQIQARWWRDGTAEPGTWGLSVTNADVAGPGWVGTIAQREGATRDWDYFSAASVGSGESAHTPAEFQNRPALPTITAATVNGEGSITFTGSAFSQASPNTHQASEWRLALPGGFASPVYNVRSTSDRTEHTITGLTPGQSYEAYVRYQGSNGHWSAWSPVRFVTGPGQVASTDFSEYATGARPTGWSLRGYASGTYAVREKTGWTGGKTLEFTDGNGTSGLRVLSWDEAGSLADVELRTRLRSDAGNGGKTMGVILRGSPTGTSGYVLTGEVPGNMMLFRMVNGQFTTLGQINGGFSAGTTYEIRFRAIGSRIQARVWVAGNPEPTSWTWDITDTEVSAPGYVGATADRENATRDWDAMSVAAGGLSVPW